MARLRWLNTATAAVTATAAIAGQSPQSIELRGRAQTLHISGSPQGQPVIVSSGDGGWIHLGPHVAAVLADKGFYVVGFDVRAYLAIFTSTSGALSRGDVPGDYRALAEFATHVTSRKPILIGVSEGAGLSVLAATDARTKAAITGVLGLGLPDLNELAWRWKDAWIYLTHKVPNEPTFSTKAIVANVAPVPLALVHSTHDEFVPAADIEAIFQTAAPPKRLWMVAASDHRFSDNVAEFDRRLVEALDWIRANAPR